MFLTFIFMQLFNSFNCRIIAYKDFNIFEDYFDSFWHLIILAIEFAATWFMVLLGGKVFRTSPLPWEMILTAAGFGLLTWGVGAALKAIPR